MGRRVKRNWDENRTALLNQSELFVVEGRGSDTYYYVWQQEPEVDECPWCGNTVVRLHDLFSRTYMDIINVNGRQTLITLEYGFHKFRCMNDECGHVFAKSIGFGSKYDNVTHRMEDQIAHWIISGITYGGVRLRLSEKISRQGIGQIFNRWVHKKDELRKLGEPPVNIAVISGKMDRERYTLILNLERGISIYDILYGVSTAEIAAVFRRIGTENIKMVLSDLDPTINEAIKDYLPEALHIIPVKYWFKLVREDFAEMAHEIIKWCPVSDKDDLIIMPRSRVTRREGDLEKLLHARPGVVNHYEAYSHLWDIIDDRDVYWMFEELEDWASALDPEFREQLNTTMMLLQFYKNEIEQHSLHRELVPDELFGLTEILEEYINSPKMRMFSPEVLRARVLYSTDADLENWQGVPIRDVISAFDNMNGDY